MIGNDIESDTLPYNNEIHSLRKTLDIFYWKNEIYLFSKENISLWGILDSCDYLHFVNDVNCGNEMSQNYWHKTSSIFKKDVLPYPWFDYLLAEPILAEIIGTESYTNDDYDDNSVLTINKGSKDGLKQGMVLYNIESDNCFYSLQLFEINEFSSKGYAQIYANELCAIASIISTKCN